MSENSLRLAASCYLDVVCEESGGRCIVRDIRTLVARTLEDELVVFAPRLLPIARRYIGYSVFS